MDINYPLFKFDNVDFRLFYENLISESENDCLAQNLSIIAHSTFLFMYILFAGKSRILRKCLPEMG